MVLSRLSFLFFLLFFLPQGLISQSVGIGTNQPHTSSLLDVHDTLKGVLFPRMSSVQRQSILQPATGLLVFDTDSARYCFYTGQDWHCLGLPPGQASGELLFWDGIKWAIVPPGNQNDRLFFLPRKARLGQPRLPNPMSCAPHRHLWNYLQHNNAWQPLLDHSKCRNPSFCQR